MKIANEKSMCCGCSACEAACPKQAIKLEQDSEGFLYPVIDDSLCINCGICEKVCPELSGYEKNSVLDTYGLKHYDENVRKTSRSGGAFSVFSDCILDKSGVVYGAAFRDDLTVCHMRAETREERDKFKGSKYAQSEQGDTFVRVLEDLSAGRYVLYSGTGCQVAGLNSFLSQKKADTSKLITVDLACHGVPSNKIWLEYLDFVKRRYHFKKIDKADFRDKSFGWKSHYESFWSDGKKVSTRKFGYLYLEHSIIRPCCFKCPYANIERPADITIADFWGSQFAVPELNDNAGVSMCLVNTEKGRRLFSEIDPNTMFSKVNIDDCIEYNPNLIHPTKEQAHRREFWEHYYKRGFRSAMRKYLRPVVMEKVKKNLLKK